MTKIRTVALAAASLALASSLAFAGPEQTIRKVLEKALPGVEITSVQPSPIKGLYEVMAGAQIMYVTGDGRYFMDGRIVDIESRTDLTEPRMSEVRKKLVDSIGEDKMIIFSPENPKHTVTVFTDIDCGYCRKLHSQIANYNAEGIRVRYVFFPRAGKKSPAYDEAVAVWCAGDEAARRTALTDAKSGKQIPAKTCDNPIDEHMAVGEEIGLRGTPGIVTEAGELIPGYVEPKRLAARLDGVASK